MVDRCRYFNKCKHKTGWCNSATAMIRCEVAIPKLEHDINELKTLLRLTKANTSKEYKNEWDYDN